jgi:SAM-dependent methyltransferase
VHAAGEPSPFLLECAGAIADASRLGPVVDLACGRGRHALALASRGVPVVAIDRDAGALASLHATARAEHLAVRCARADLEGAAFPLRPGSCGALIVFRYLHRPLARDLAALLRPGGVLVYETFTIHQRELGTGPRNPSFLLEPGELPRLFPQLAVVHLWEGITRGPAPNATARLLARRLA